MGEHTSQQRIYMVGSETGQEDGRCRVEVMTLTITSDSDEDSEDEDLIDGHDRQIVDSTGTVNRH